MGRIQTFADLGCLVTGASSGIGRDIARLLAREGARLAITARRAQRLETLAAELRALGAGDVHVLPEDLSDPTAPARLAARASECLRGVDVLVNNAGFAVPGLFLRSDLARTLSMLQVNCAAAVELTRILLPGMLARDRGGILTVASVAAFQAAPYQTAYSATKAFLLNFSDSLHQELKGSQLAVTALCPGVTDTEFFEAAGYRHLTKLLRWRMPSMRVAQAGVKAFRKGRMGVVPGLLNKAMIFSQRFLPRSFVAACSRRLMGTRTLPRGRGDDAAAT